MMKRSVVLLLALGACARPQPAPGGDPDRQAPGLVSTSPAALARVTDPNATVVFRFDERLRTRSFNRTFVTVMPGEPDEFQVSVHGNEVRVSRRAGWLPGQIYHVVVRTGIEDLFGNRRSVPAELVFSTGPEVPFTAIAGMVQDRVTRQGARDAQVQAVRRADSTVYRTAADSASFFALRHAPYGTYDVVAFSDRNRNNRLDAGEPRSGISLVNLGAGADTVMVMFELLPHDSTGPRLSRAELADSTHLRLTFDDYIDAENGTGGASLEVYQLPDSTLYQAGGALQLPAAFEAERERSRAAADTGRARADTARADTARPAPPRRPGIASAQRPTGPVADRTVIATVMRPLVPGEYAVVVRNIRNVNGLVGSGSVRFTVRAATRAPGDTTRLRP